MKLSRFVIAAGRNEINIFVVVILSMFAEWPFSQPHSTSICCVTDVSSLLEQWCCIMATSNPAEVWRCDWQIADNGSNFAKTTIGW